MKTHIPSRLRRSLALLCGLALSGLLQLHAQDETTTSGTSASEGMGHAFGVKGGVNWSNLRVKDVHDDNARFGFHAGLFARFASPGSLGFQLEALYDQKGNTMKKVIDNIDQEYTYKFDYITVPGLVVIPLGEVLELHAGAYAAFMILSEQTSKGDLGNSSYNPDDNQFKTFDYGLVGGAGINLGMAQIGARYEHGLGTIAGNESAKKALGDSMNSTLQFYLAMALGKR